VKVVHDCGGRGKRRRGEGGAAQSGNECAEHTNNRKKQIEKSAQVTCHPPRRRGEERGDGDVGVVKKRHHCGCNMC